MVDDDSFDFCRCSQCDSNHLTESRLKRRDWLWVITAYPLGCRPIRCLECFHRQWVWLHREWLKLPYPAERFRQLKWHTFESLRLAPPEKPVFKPTLPVNRMISDSAIHASDPTQQMVDTSDGSDIRAESSPALTAAAAEHEH